MTFSFKNVLVHRQLTLKFFKKTVCYTYSIWWASSPADTGFGNGGGIKIVFMVMAFSLVIIQSIMQTYKTNPGSFLQFRYFQAYFLHLKVLEARYDMPRTLMISLHDTLVAAVKRITLFSIWYNSMRLLVMQEVDLQSCAV
jgi:hypothetical protein